MVYTLINTLIFKVTFLQPTRSDRSWFIDPLGKNEWYSIPLAILPALLATILIFMDQQITAVIVNRKENKLKVCSYVGVIKTIKQETSYSDNWHVNYN